MLMSNLSRVQDVDLVHLNRVTVEGFEFALRACCNRLKKLKLLAPLRFLLSSELLEEAIKISSAEIDDAYPHPRRVTYVTQLKKKAETIYF
ncbi:hypothetical protein DY000_02025938 [Brassica cretica]|nr:hypothetical protein DY000_02025938 [Brassica cretica]